ncbi:MAG: DUF924 family protein [Candidatus Omnitrophota bacterium]
MERMNAILNFWFENISDETHIDKNKMPFKKWFMKDKNFDAQIKKEFEPDLGLVKSGGYKMWEKSSRGRLALIILCDQLSRNMYRDSSRMFETDPLALELSLRSVNDRSDEELRLIERVFLYMPFQHAEDLKIQEISLKVFSELVQEVRIKNPGNVSYYEYTLQFAKRHFDIIKRFNRFPHRNKILGRASTLEEQEFLKNPGSGF